MLKSGITEIGPCPKAFTTARGKNGQSDTVQADGTTSGCGIRSSEETADTPPSDLSQGCALSKPLVSTRFTPEVKAYLNSKFELGEKKKTGLKADRNQVSTDMRHARDEENNRRFSREEWLTKNQIKI